MPPMMKGKMPTAPKGLAVVIGVGKEKPAAEPTGPPGLPAEEAPSKESANYFEDQNCIDCSDFTPEDSRCNIWNDTVSAMGHCDRFNPGSDKVEGETEKVPETKEEVPTK